MIETRNEGGKTYSLEAVITECTCEICEDHRSAGYQTYESLAYLGEMMIGFDCGACSEKDAIDYAEEIYQMFDLGELGTNPHEFFTPEAIKHVRSR